MAFTARSQRVRCGRVPIASSEVASFYGTREYAILGNALVGINAVKKLGMACDDHPTHLASFIEHAHRSALPQYFRHTDSGQ